MSFADVEDRANASVMGRMRNATASIAAGASVPVIFDNGAAAVMQGLAETAQASIHILASDLGAHGTGATCALTYKGVTTQYKLRNPLPDGTGMVICALELLTP